jgi:hypothetical protein
MIQVDIPMPETCAACPMAEWYNDELLRCAALVYRNRATKTETQTMLVDEYATRKPKRCPIVGTV